MNTFGYKLTLTTFGESHGEAIGGVLDGVPAGIMLDINLIQSRLDRRKPGQSHITTSRKETDRVRLLSGVFQGETTGMPIGFIIESNNQKSRDYADLKDVFRPSHADYTYQKKYAHRDYRGGGRSSARETANWVVAGAIAQQIIQNVKITAYTSSVGDLFLESAYQTLDFSKIEDTPVRCPDIEVAKKMEEKIVQMKKEGDTIGGTVTCVVQNTPIGLGEPIFNKLHAQLAKAMMGINAVKGFEYGAGFCAARMTGSQHNDLFNIDGTTTTNLSGGIQGGISNSMDIYFRVAFKPVATLMQAQSMLKMTGELVKMEGKGRHDPCVVPRAVPVVEALTALVLADFYLLNR